jgi:hypothetical protein
MRNKILTLFVTISLTFSCSKDKGLNWLTHYSLPIAETTIRLNHIIPDSLFDFSDSPIKLVYKSLLYEINKSDLFSIPDTTIKTTFAIPFGSFTVFPGQTINESEQEINLPTGQAGLSKMIVESGKLKYKIKSKILQATTFRYEIKSASLNGVGLVIEVGVPGAISIDNPAIVQGEADLSGYAIDLTGVNNNSLNKVVVLTKLSLANDAQSTSITPSNGIEFYATFETLIPDYAKGYFGQSSIHVGPSLSNIDVFKNVQSGSFHLNKARCTLEIVNGIGIDARIHIQKIESVGDKQVVSLNSNFINKNININRAVDNPYKHSTKQLLFDETTSNITSLIENMSKAIGYEMDVLINPLGNISNGTDFIYSDKLLKAYVHLEIPLKTKTNQLVLQDTIRIQMDTVNQAFINQATINFGVKNYFGQDISLKAFILDENNLLGQELTAQNNIKPMVSTTKRQQVTVVLSNKNLKQLFKSKKLVVQFTLDSQSSFIEINKDSRVELSVSADIEKTTHIN